MPTIQEALAGLQNPASMRQAILQRLNINPGQYGANQIGGLGANTDFDKTINDLYRQGAETSGSLDIQEGDTNTNYQKGLAQAAIDRDKALDSIRNNFAARGMSFSSANADELQRANSSWDTYVGNLGQNRDSALADIGNRRNSLLEGLTRGRQTAEEGFGGDISSFLQEQAVAAWNAALQAEQQRQMLAALNRPPQVIVQRAPAAPAARPAAPRLPTAAPRPAAIVPPAQYSAPAVQKSNSVLRGQGYAPTGRGPF